MKNGMSSVSDKVSSLPTPADSDIVGSKLQASESFSKMAMMNHHRPFSPSQPLCGDDESSGPTCNELGCSSNIYGDGDAAAQAPAKVMGTLQQPFPISTTTDSSPKSPGGMGYHPFTSAQWKELERQAMIYKYMVASVPVPPDLLFPFTQNLSAAAVADSSASHPPLGGGSIFNLKFTSSKDPEPGRCKRTDGKKWRCSRDVAPNQKYCERHLHRGRPRSRKHVEVHHPPLNINNKKKTRLPHTRCSDLIALSTHSSSPQLPGSTIPPNETSSSLVFEPTRGLDWMMEPEMVAMETSEQQWQQLITEGAVYYSNPSISQPYYGEEPINLLSLSEKGDSHGVQYNDEYNLFPNPYFPSLDNLPQMEAPRYFIDAWPNDNRDAENNKNESSVSGYGNLSPSSLNLSMAMALGDVLDKELSQIQMGLGVSGDTDDDYKFQIPSWLSNFPWMASTPGGPLAEVLQPGGTTAMGSNPGSPNGGNNGDAISPPATCVSSPSGVLQRTMLSLSDSSVCNSPTLAPAVPEVVGFQ